MFMVAVTRAPLESARFQGCTMESYPCPSFMVTFVHDGFFSHLAAEVDGLVLTQGLTPTATGDQACAHLSLKKRNGGHVLSISNPTSLRRFVYYTSNAQGEFFCSSHIGPLRAAGIAIQEDRDSLPEFMVYRHVVPPKSLFQGIRILPAGGTIEADIHNNCESKVHFSLRDYISAEKRALSEEDTRKIQARLRAGLAKLRPYSPLYFQFSGGLDSSTLFALGKEVLGNRDVYSTSYPFEAEATNIEEKYSVSAARAFGATHHYYRSSNEEYLFAFLESIAEAEQPVDHLQSVMFNLLFKREMNAGSGVIVSGTGADSIFGGATQSKIFMLSKRPALYRVLSRPGLIRLMRAASRLSGKGEGRIDFIAKAPRIHEDYEDPDNIVWDLSKYGSLDWVCQYYGVDKTKPIQNRLEMIRTIPGASVFDILSVLAVFASSDTVWSVLAESAGHLMYYPYCTESLIKTMFGIHWADKLAQPKNVLRKIAREIGVPEFIITRKKSGFGVNPSRWATRGSLFEPLLALCSRVFPEAELRRFQSTDLSKAMTYWNILNYALWKRIVIHGEPVAELQAELRDRLRSIKS